ncbi:MAG: GNAT family N-acetyltransferase, partial [Brevundimonas sp.]
MLAARPTPASPYVAFLPLRMRVHFDEERGFFNELYLAGGGYSDHAGLLARPDFEGAAIAALSDHLRKKLNWARLTLTNLWMSERRRRLFLSTFDELRFAHKDINYIDPVTKIDVNICPSAALPPDWDAYLEGRSANNRQKIRRWLRKVEASENYDITPADAETQAADIETLLGLWKTKWAGRKGARAESIVQRNRNMLTRCAENGTLFLPVFRHGGRPVAALAILVDRPKKAMLFFLAGRDEGYDEAPAGFLLHAYSIRHAISQGFAHYEFLLGNEPYKYVFASREGRLRACSVATRSGRNLGGALDSRGLGAMRDMALDLEKKNAVAAAEGACRKILTMQPDDALTLCRLGRLR